MPFTVNAYAALNAISPLVPHRLERRDVQEHDVLIAIDYCGICHTDLHIAHDDWNIARYPVVPGHEIVGRVEALGSAVDRFRVGEVVAVGCIVDSCRECEQCDLSHEISCLNGPTQTYNDPEKRFPGHITAGGYSEKIVVPDYYVLSVPRSLQQEKLLPGVAPLLCAGVTTFSVLREYNVGKHSKVGIAGFGGLGSMGVKLAHALGAGVSVISRSHKKEAVAKGAGASALIASTSEQEMIEAQGSLDMILDTIPWDHNINSFIPLLKPYGVLVVVGYEGTLGTPPDSRLLIRGNKTLAGSLIGGIRETQELLNFCGEKAIISDYELTTLEDVNDAWASLNQGDLSRRIVLDIQRKRGAPDETAQ